MYDKLRVIIINKDVRKSLARKNGNESPIWSWNDSPPGEPIPVGNLSFLVDGGIPEDEEIVWAVRRLCLNLSLSCP